MNGFLNLNKPFGLTSHDCVARVRRLLKQKRVGHGGTLDPAATGVLPIAVGKATRLLQYLPSEKAYRAKIRFGVTTTTDDLAGEVLSQTAAADLSLAQVEAMLPQFIGEIRQIPPSYSAIQVGGKRLYELARAGQTVEAPVRIVEVKQIKLLSWHPGDFPELEADIICGAGTYIRSIARDLGAALGTGATLAGLTRTASSGFQLADSQTFEQLEAHLNLVPPTVALQHLPILRLDQPSVKHWQQGQRLSWNAVAKVNQASSFDLALPSRPYQIQQRDGQFLGIGQISDTPEDQLLVPKLVWQ